MPMSLDPESDEFRWLILKIEQNLIAQAHLRLLVDEAATGAESSPPTELSKLEARYAQGPRAVKAPPSRRTAKNLPRL